MHRYAKLWPSILPIVLLSLSTRRSLERSYRCDKAYNPEGVLIEIHGHIRIGKRYLRSVIEVSVGESGSVAIPVSRRDDYDKLEIDKDLVYEGNLPGGRSTEDDRPSFSRFLI
ncbi:hypothetical protein V1477_001172 [Vespula maculifrons]|uniref:Uncharacterized protein n=1 Tax=Vespula maculifrons TaxID=7453 RepID=A0ABD2CZU6_VESMC